MAIIEIKNLEKIYRDETETTALRGVNFSIEVGEFVSIMGPSGSGKSTLLHILGFLDRLTEGEYLFDGKSMNDYSDEELAVVRNKKMGFVFQSFNLLPRTTVLENVKLPLLYSNVKESLWNDIALKAIDSVGLTERIDHESSRLSGGEKQRVAIARALVNDPSLILADEPTGNLDTKTGEVVLSTFQELNEKQNRTIILITHERYVAEHADRIITIRDGVIVEDEINRKKRKLNGD